jgi:hypothetical protein
MLVAALSRAPTIRPYERLVSRTRSAIAARRLANVVAASLRLSAGEAEPLRWMNPLD